MKFHYNVVLSPPSLMEVALSSQSLSSPVGSSKMNVNYPDNAPGLF